MKYAELHCRSGFSFLDGASHPQELLARAIDLELPALALTDRNGLYGIVEAREALLELSGLERRDEEGRSRLRLLYGSELTIEDGDAAVVIVKDLAGYGHLAGAITKGRLAACE